MATQMQQNNITPLEAVCGDYRGRFVRDLFTGVLREVPSEGGGRRIIAREISKYGRRESCKTGADWRNYVNLGMSIKPEEATPERIARENEEARRHGTGAYYTMDGLCHTEGRQITAREMRRRGRQMNNPGWSDCAGQ